MSDILSTNVSYSFNLRDATILGKFGKRLRGSITFGNGALTVPSTGVPLTKGKLGCPRFIRSLIVLGSSASGYDFEYDATNESIKLLVSGISTGNLSSNSAGTPAGTVAAPKINLTSASGNVAADKVIGLNALSNGAELQANAAIVNVIGVQAPAFSGSALSAHSHVFTGDAVAGSNFVGAPAALTLQLEVEGY